MPLTINYFLIEQRNKVSPYLRTVNLSLALVSIINLLSFSSTVSFLYILLRLRSLLILLNKENEHLRFKLKLQRTG